MECFMFCSNLDIRHGLSLGLKNNIGDEYSDSDAWFCCFLYPNFLSPVVWLSSSEVLHILQIFTGFCIPFHAGWCKDWLWCKLRKIGNSRSFKKKVHVMFVIYNFSLYGMILIMLLDFQSSQENLPFPGIQGESCKCFLVSCWMHVLFFERLFLWTHGY